MTDPNLIARCLEDDAKLITRRLRPVGDAICSFIEGAPPVFLLEHVNAIDEAADRLEAVAGRIGELREVVEKCRDKFLEYEQTHLAKVRPHIQGVVWSNKIADENSAAQAKAARNREMADLCTTALSKESGK